MFRALHIQQDKAGNWWLDVSKADVWPPRLSNIPHKCKSLEEMPIEVREKLACLRLTDVDVVVEGVGRRVSDNTFWVYIYEKPKAKVRRI